MKLSVLGSGSRGNSTLISNGDFSLLIDAGFSGRELDERLSTLGYSLKEIGAVLITHDHGDHINGAGVVARNAGATVFTHKKTEKKLRRRLGKRVEFEFIEANDSFELGGMKITPFETPHDAIRSVGYIIESDGYKIGYATDVGHPSETVIHSLKQCDTLVLESNHDSSMLATGPYPPVLKERVGGDEGHLSNDETAEILREVVHEGLERVILVHLSEENNEKEIVLETASEVLNSYSTEIVVSSQYSPTELFTLTNVKTK
jgi:phosphoribosyl 1,2-cyclic phosphodiesterase